MKGGQEYCPILGAVLRPKDVVSEGRLTTGQSLQLVKEAIWLCLCTQSFHGG